MDVNVNGGVIEGKAGRFAISTEAKYVIYMVMAVALGVCAYLGPFASGESPRRVLGITIFMLVMWVTEPISLAVTGLLGCWLFWAVARVPGATVFSGFTNDTPWFTLGGLLLGLVDQVTGMARRLAFNIIARIGGNYKAILLAMMVVNFLLTLIIPSGVAKVVIVCAIALGLVESYSMPRNSNIAKGLVLAMTYQTAIFDRMILAGAGTILARGLIQQFGKVQVTGGIWFIAFLPVVIVTILASWYIILKILPPERLTVEGGQDYCRSELRRMGAMTTRQVRGMIIVLGACLLFATDFLHHIELAIICLGASLIACLPGVGVLKKDDFAKVNFSMVIFVATAICMGNVMVKAGILKTLTAALFKWMVPVLHSAFPLAGPLLYFYANVFHLFLGNESAMVTASIPPLMNFALDNGFNPRTLGLIWAFAVGGRVFVYQGVVLAIGYSYGTFTAKDLFKLGLCLYFVETVLLLVIVPLYWPLLGLTIR